MCAAAAAACAEYLNEKYLEQLDPDEHAIAMEQVYDQIMLRNLGSEAKDDLPLGGIN